MRVAIDARGINWYTGTGIGTYTDKVLRYLLKMDSENYYHIYWSGENYEEFQKPNTKLLMASKKYHRFFEQNYFPQNLKEEKIDIYHVPQNGIGLNENIDCKKIATMHDLIPYIMPETVGKGYLLKFLKDVPKVIELCDALITVSEYSKQDILKFFPIDKDKIFVTPLAAEDIYIPMDKVVCREFLKVHYNITKPFILYIGGFSPRKNVKALISAFSKVYKGLGKDYNLVITGAARDQKQYLKDFSMSLELEEKIIFTGFAPEEHLPILYNGSDVFVYPSLYEGFGLPPLEAMNCGTPVISSNLTSIPEVVGDAGMLINPYDEKELPMALLTLLNSHTLQMEYIKKGLERAKSFSWENTAKNTLAVYKKVYELNTN